MPSQGSLFTNFEDVQLTDEERVYLNAAYLGNLGIVRQSLEECGKNLNVNCVDYMGRNALHLAIDSEKLDVVEVLLDTLNFTCIEEALLHAISKGAVKIVKIITEHPNFMAGEDRLKRLGGGEAFFRTDEKSQFPPDITPLTLSAHYNNHEIIQIFLSRNHRIEKPHAISCRCTDCVTKQNYDSLKRSRSRLNAYRALASPAYMALSYPDPIMTTFELRQEMMKLAEVEKEFKFVAHPNCQQHMTNIWYGSEMGFLQSLHWFKQILYAIMFLPAIPFLCVLYIVLPNTKLGAVMRCPVTKFITHTASHLCFLILLTAATFRLTESGVSINSIRELNHSRYAYLSVEEKVESLLKETLRPANTLITHVQICIVFWILGLLWIECKQIYSSGGRSYFTDYYNFMDFSVLSMYLASYVLRFITEFMVSDADRYFNGTVRARELLLHGNYTYYTLLVEDIKDARYAPKNYFMEASRFQWKSNDPEIVSDVLFAIANVISFARTTYLMPAFEVLGPLQISLGRMIGDITRFMVLFMLVLFAFMVGLHNLYWYYGTQRIKMTMNKNDTVHVYAAEAFQGLRQTFYSLFWSIFGQVSINDINVKHPAPGGARQCMLLDSDRNKILCSADVYGNKSAVYSSGHAGGLTSTDSSTAIVEGVGMYLFGIYHVVIIIVLINMLIAMMSHSFEDIQGDCDVEWKFARNKLWMNYMDEGSTLPVPFNMIPSPKSLIYVWRFCQRLLISRNGKSSKYNNNRRQTFIKKRREMACKSMSLKADDSSYSDIMQRLVKRYLFKLERAKDEKEKVKDSIPNISNIPTEQIELMDDDESPPPLPHSPRNLPYATPTIHEDADETETDTEHHTSFKAQSRSSFRRRRGSQRPNLRKLSTGSPQVATSLMIPQLDGILRSQKLLDVRLQHLQASCKETNRIIDDVEFLRRVMTENQKAMFNIISALGNIQSEIVNLARCLASSFISSQPNAHVQANAHPQANSVLKVTSGRKRPSQEDEESRL
ncbi:hypothetical protein ACJMK2_035003 [Sinanodonta woodiana]|uniref:Transient receptor ion channel domain-containing protein n=1 Tax=Sinanodonta woodiana TaxID=1069815 RepID=A0ABD3WV64_SINWO